MLLELLRFSRWRLVRQAWHKSVLILNNPYYFVPTCQVTLYLSGRSLPVRSSFTCQVTLYLSGSNGSLR